MLKRNKIKKQEKNKASHRAGIRGKKYDSRFLFGIAGFLIVWGILTVGAASFPLSLENFGHPWQYLFHQLMALGIGLALGFTAYKIPLKKIKKWAPHLFLFSLILLFAVFIPKIGVKSGGAYRWISLGGFSFQPSELLKITFILYLSFWIASKAKGARRESLKKMILPFGFILGVLLVVLLLQSDMTTLGIICLVALLMYLLSSVPWWHIILLIGSGSAIFTIFILTTPYRLARFFTFLNPELDPLGKGYQLKQAFIALGSGRLFGIGQGFSFGLSHQKFGFLPEAITDSIFAIIGEELGFFGVSLLVILFLALFFEGIRLALRAPGEAEKLLVFGISSWLILQAFLNISGIIGIAPIGGIPLPFFSYGGSHLIAEIIGIGLLLNVAKNT